MSASDQKTDVHLGADPRVGTVVQDRYRIVRRLGEGGMGIVYEGEHLLIRRRVAIKLLHAQFAADPTVVRRFHNEAIAATSIGNPHIVDCTDMGRLPDGTFFMVLEFLQGKDFSHVIDREGPQPVGRTVHVVSQLCDALTAAHDKGIIHRDLKPENIFLIEQGDDPDFVKVLDFGIAKFMEGRDESMTQTGQTIGTPHFMSPEQLQGSKHLDRRADLYATGVILYHALTGRFPFEAETFPLLIMSIFNHPPINMTHYRQDLPPGLVEIIGRLLAKTPEHRFDSAAELKAALAPFRQVSDAPQMTGWAPPQQQAPDSGIQAAQQTNPLGGATRSPGTPPTMAVVSSAPGTEVSAHSQPGGHASSSPHLSGGQPMQPVAAPSSKLPLVVASGSLVATLAVVVLVVFGMNRGEGESESDVPPPPPPPAQQEDEGQPTVNVRISAEPGEAELFLDGDPIPNPFDADLPSSREGRRLEARLEGYQTISRMLSVRFPQRVHLELEPEPEEPEVEEPEPQARADRPARPRRPRPQPQPQPASVATPTPRPSTPHPTTQPSQPPNTGASNNLKRIRF